MIARRGELLVQPGFVIEELPSSEETLTSLALLGARDARIQVKLTQISQQYTYLGCITCKHGKFVSCLYITIHSIS
jgi:hypothetical protein